MTVPPVHVVIPDCQIRPGVPTRHLEWVGRYICDQFDQHPDLTVVQLGDFWDMASLSSYDRGKKAMEGRRYTQDIDAGNEAFAKLSGLILANNKGRRKKWSPRRVFLLGNHEDRITRAAESDAQIDGLVTLDHLCTDGWEVHPFLEPVDIHGISYAHYFYNPMTGRPYASAVELRLKTLGHSFTMGHQQGLKWGRVDTTRGPHIGLIVGSCYEHDEEFMGPQGNNYWRGIVVKHQVSDGSYDPMMVSLSYLSRRYTGKPL